ncbi:antitoxin MazE family protein [Reyranella sp.]|uniref:antitoxin MazE family protein n=1 Tax=Reyranella sp. TaxID=1929291 RepID=UPI003F723D62
MPRSKGGKSAAQESRHRDRMGALGLRPIQVWVPDVRSAAFRREAHRQSLAVARSARVHEDQTFIDAASEWQDA